MNPEFNFDLQFENMMKEHGLDSVILLGHMNPDGDAAGCVMGLAHYIKTQYPEYAVFPYLADTLDKGPKKQVQEDRVFDPFMKPEVYRFAVIVCDTATKARMIGREYYEQAEASIVLDHHASNEGYGDVNDTRISEACAENVFRMLDPNHLAEAAKKPHPNAADYIYMGILHDTGGFARTNAALYRAGAELLEMGADHVYVMKTMRSQTLERLDKQAKLLGMAQKIEGGKAAYVFVAEAEKIKGKIRYEDIHPISGILRDCEDIELGITFYEEEPAVWRCSFRSDGKWINVNELLTPFGGGGHAAAAGLRIRTEDPQKLLQDIFARIHEMTAKHG